MSSSKKTCFSSTEPQFRLEDMHKDLAAMTEEQREEARNDLCGVQPTIENEETSEFIIEKLFELELCLEQADREKLRNFNDLLATLEAELSHITEDRASELLKKVKYSSSDVFCQLLDKIEFVTDDSNEHHNDIDFTIEKLVLELNSLETMEPIVQSQFLCPEYANSDSFRIMFLRAEHFDVEMASKRLTTYWKEKVKLFGERAFKEITLDDMKDEDEAAITGGGFQILPEKDAHGRAIFFSYRQYWDLRPERRLSMVRTMWYVLHTVIEDESVQKNGIVCIFTGQKHTDTDIFSATRDFLNFKLNRILLFSSQVLPVRFVGAHTIIKNSFFRKLAMSSILACTPRSLRARLKDHDSGDVDETLTSLMNYGMPPRILPAEIGGYLELNYREWLDDRREEGL